MRLGISATNRLSLVACAVAVIAVGCGTASGPDEPRGPDSTSSSTSVPAEPTTTTTSEPAMTTTSTTTTTTPTTTSTSTTTTSSTTTTQPSTTTTRAQTAFPPGSEVVTVSSITDGDTIKVRFGNGSVDTVRLIGINTPEKGECFAAEATAALKSLLTAEINEEMVAQGFALARDYPPDSRYATRLSAAQKKASNARLGLWAADACGVAGGGVIKVGHIEYDAPGNDNENLNGEWVELVNPGPGSVIMIGWVLKDESASHRFNFPNGFTLAAGANVKVFTGCGTNTATDLYWCKSGSAVWNNNGDTAFILDPNGNVIDSKSY